ncbi:MAG: glycosyltransferase family 2 protein [Phycisphaerales bacterium]|nr:glycosyltransferase family 2 protein [Phycisphaerales bacterium]
MPSVVIPAHNEEAGIERTLRGVLADAVPDLEIVVVVNATTDRTAEIAAGVDPRIKVIDTPTPGKTNALNLGEAEVSGFPRMFLDADIELRSGAVTHLLAGVDERRRIVSPRPHFDRSNLSFGMRLFYRAQRFNPYFGDGAPNGSGCFVVGESGRARWGEFPEIIADDGFVQGHFEPSERFTVSEAEAVVLPPQTLAAMITVRARVRRGTYELHRRFPELMKNHVARGGGVFKRLAVRPWEWPAMLVYGYVRISERLIARRQTAAGTSGWGRDETARSAD